MSYLVAGISSAEERHVSIELLFPISLGLLKFQRQNFALKNSPTSVRTAFSIWECERGEKCCARTR